MRPAHAVRLHDALGRAGRAGRIDDVEGPVGRRCHRCTAGAARRQPGVEASPGVRSVEGDARNRCAPRRGEGLGRAGVDEQQLRAGIVEHGGEALAAAAGRQRRHRHAGAQGAQEDGGVATRCGGADGDRIARRDAIALQAGDDAVHQHVELAIAQRHLGVDQRHVPGSRCACLRIRSATRPNSSSKGVAISINPGSPVAGRNDLQVCLPGAARGLDL